MNIEDWVRDGGFCELAPAQDYPCLSQLQAFLVRFLELEREITMDRVLIISVPLEYQLPWKRFFRLKVISSGCAWFSCAIT